ncbi:hypothetical protein BXZ70DRAFT_1076175 [Cristinia sonorae]|uniref:Uncharacterized protein n=1 Tax=Cristinia sonorae TaxID=1940300 RepID=A0A8K0UT10_9AGAR|nr:hypothetical protein BXZ70DRAFT_1076175 [Cristinia sonorae]
MKTGYNPPRSSASPYRSETHQLRMSNSSHHTPKRQAWLQTGPPTYSPPEKESQTRGKKRAKSCDDESESGGDEYVLTAFGDVSPEDPYIPLGSRRYNLRPRVPRPPHPSKKDSVGKYESSYTRALAEHLRNSSRESSPSQDFKDFMDSVKSRKKMRRGDAGSMSSNPRGSTSSHSPISAGSTSSPSSSPSSASSDSVDHSPIPVTRVHRRPPLPKWDE